MRRAWLRLQAALRRHARQAPAPAGRRVAPRRVRRPGRWVTGSVCLVIGLMISVSSLNARGYDLRPGRNTELIEVIRDNGRRNAELTRVVGDLRTDVDDLTRLSAAEPATSERLVQVSDTAGLTGASGPGFTVILTDAPLSVQVPGIDEDLLVVHQQDIQAVANALWQSGAEAMTIQGQRVITTTGIKCVGNSVVLHGIPYSPPYVLSAIGDPDRLAAGIASSPYLEAYRQHAEAYDLGYQQRREPTLAFPPFQGSVELRHARAT